MRAKSTASYLFYNNSKFSGCGTKKKAQPRKMASLAVTLAPLLSSRRAWTRSIPWTSFPEHNCLADGDQHRVMFHIVMEHRYIVRGHPQHTNSRVVFENVWTSSGWLTRPRCWLLLRERARRQDEMFRFVEKMLCSHPKLHPTWYNGRFSKEFVIVGCRVDWIF